MFPNQEISINLLNNPDGIIQTWGKIEVSNSLVCWIIQVMLIIQLLRFCLQLLDTTLLIYRDFLH